MKMEGERGRECWLVKKDGRKDLESVHAMS